MTEADLKKIDRLLAPWFEWELALTARPRLIGAVNGGRTNRNFRLSAPGLASDLLLRINHSDPQRLGIDRALERDILTLTAGAGIGRPCLYWDPAQRFALFPYLEARPWTPADLQQPDQVDRLWSLVEQLGQLPLNRPRRRYADYLRHYWRQLAQAGAIDRALSARWRAFEPEVLAFDQASWPARLVHHDLLPANVLDTGERLVLIDWEYAALGHPDIDIWSIDPSAIGEPFIAELMGWVNDLWERLARIPNVGAG